MAHDGRQTRGHTRLPLGKTGSFPSQAGRGPWHRRGGSGTQADYGHRSAGWCTCTYHLPRGTRVREADGRRKISVRVRQACLTQSRDTALRQVCLNQCLAVSWRVRPFVRTQDNLHTPQDTKALCIRVPERTCVKSQSTQGRDFVFRKSTIAEQGSARVLCRAAAAKTLMADRMPLT